MKDTRYAPIFNSWKQTDNTWKIPKFQGGTLKKNPDIIRELSTLLINTRWYRYRDFTGLK